MPQLEPAVRSPRGAARARPAALTALVVGALAMAAATAGQLERGGLFVGAPDQRLTLPCFALALLAAVVSLVRREGGRALSICGVALAAAALAPGAVLVIGAVAIVAIAVIHLLGEIL